MQSGCSPVTFGGVGLAVSRICKIAWEDFCKVNLTHAHVGIGGFGKVILLTLTGEKLGSAVEDFDRKRRAYWLCSCSCSCSLYEGKL